MSANEGLFYAEASQRINVYTRNPIMLIEQLSIKQPRTISFSSCGRYLAVGCLDGYIFVFRVIDNKHKLIWKNRIAEPEIRFIEFTPDDNYVFFSGNKTVHRLSIANGKVEMIKQFDTTMIWQMQKVDNAFLFAVCGKKSTELYYMQYYLDETPVNKWIQIPVDAGHGEFVLISKSHEMLFIFKNMGMGKTGVKTYHFNNKIITLTHKEDFIADVTGGYYKLSPDGNLLAITSIAEYASTDLPNKITRKTRLFQVNPFLELIMFDTPIACGAGFGPKSDLLLLPGNPGKIITLNTYNLHT